MDLTTAVRAAIDAARAYHDMDETGRGWLVEGYAIPAAAWDAVRAAYAAAEPAERRAA